MTWQETVDNQIFDMNLSTGGESIRYIPIKVNKSEKPLLVIGLGGTGLRIAMQTKDMFIQRFNPAVKPDPRVDPRLPPFTRFLAIDTDEDDMKRLGVPEGERCLIGCRDLASLLKPENRSLLPDYVNDWLNPALVSRGGNGVDGAQGIRQIGRFDLFQNVGEVIRSIKTALNQIMSGRGVIYVVIAAGVAGGTGSGTFLDMPYLVRHAASELSIRNRIRIIGYLVTPDVYAALPSNDPNNAFVQRANGYASLKELDYWMEAVDRFDPLVQTYAPNTHVAWDVPPFEDCILLSSQTVGGHAPQAAYDTLRGVVAEYITSMFADEAAQRDATNAERDYGFSYTSYRSNVGTIVTNTPRRYEVCRRYTAIGACNGQLPLQELTLHEGIFLFREMREQYAHHPDHFQETVFTEFLSPVVGQEIRNAFGAVVQPNPRKSTIKQIRHSDRIAPHDPKIDKSVNVYHEALQITAKGNVMEELVAAKVSRLEQALIDMFTNPKLGPFYTARFINRTPGYYQQATDSLAAAVDGTYDLLTLLQKRLKESAFDMASAKSNYDQAVARAVPEYNTIRTALIEPMQDGPTARRYYTACDDANAAIRLQNEKSVLKHLYELMIEKVTELRDNVIAPLLFTLEKLVRLYNADEAFIQTEAYKPKKTPYDYDIVSLELLAANLQSTYNTPEATDKLLSNLFKDMMKPYTIDPVTNRPVAVGKEDRWIIADERSNRPVSINVRDNLERVVNDYFREFNSKTTLVNFLKLQYPEDVNPDSSLNVPVVMDKLRDTFTKNASPMFLPSTVHNPSTTAVMANYITVPKDTPGVGTALGKGNSEVKLSAINDRIFWISSMDNVSLYHYGDLLNCERDYTNKALLGNHLGAHLWEGKKRNWKTLPNPLPRIARDITYNNPVQIESDQALLARVNRLLAQKTIQIDEVNLNLHAFLKNAKTDALCKTIGEDVAANRLSRDDAQAMQVQLLAARDDVVISMDSEVLASYNGDRSARCRELAYDIFMQRPALVERLETDSQALAPTAKALDDIINHGTHLEVLLANAARLADLMAFGVLKSPNRIHYSYEYESGSPVVFYNTMTDNAVYSAKYNVAYGLECGILDKMLDAAAANHPEHGKYMQLTELEQAMLDELSGVDTSRLEILTETFAAEAPKLKAKLTTDANALKPKQLRELNMDGVTKTFLINFKQAMAAQIDARATGLGINL